MSDLTRDAVVVEDSIVDDIVVGRCINASKTDEDIAKAAITASSTTLFQFPLEIRREIYRVLLVTTVPLSPVWETWSICSGDQRSLHSCNSRIYVDLAIFRTCTRIYAEASEIFYRENVFRFRIMPYDHYPLLPTMNCLADLVHVCLFHFGNLETIPGCVEQQVEFYVHDVLNHCPSLKSFTLHLDQTPAWDVCARRLLRPSPWSQVMLKPPAGVLRKVQKSTIIVRALTSDKFRVHHVSVRILIVPSGNIWKCGMEVEVEVVD